MYVNYKVSLSYGAPPEDGRMWPKHIAGF
jgi:hypothetical protein